MKLKEIMTKDVTAVSAGTSIYDVAQIMKDQNIGSVPICSNGMNVEGMITDRDIVLRVVCEDRDLKTTKCEDIMTDELVVGKIDMEVEAAIELMGDVQVRRLPVVDNGKLVGFVALGDMAVNDRFDRSTEEALSEISKQH
ncbi:MAG: CBS domain-containing protein [Clostridia bacterium]|nr:CBS domain-containing protein [Clostridia bacterium]MDD4048052.1 CBS domain-containing protein [Clostridia bacterium]